MAKIRIGSQLCCFMEEWEVRKRVEAVIYVVYTEVWDGDIEVYSRMMEARERGRYRWD